MENFHVYAPTYVSLLVLVLKGGVAVYLWDVGAGGTALVWCVGSVAGQLYCKCVVSSWF